ncbi:MAG: hypothetical protein NT069_12805 [Planctomycetota bacterium]|nr:hypothetical protein [Planctomycetota bacterium]
MARLTTTPTAKLRLPDAPIPRASAETNSVAVMTALPVTVRLAPPCVLPAHDCVLGLTVELADAPDAPIRTAPADETQVGTVAISVDCATIARSPPIWSVTSPTNAATVAEVVAWASETPTASPATTTPVMFDVAEFVATAVTSRSSPVGVVNEIPSAIDALTVGLIVAWAILPLTPNALPSPPSASVVADCVEVAEIVTEPCGE